MMNVLNVRTLALAVLATALAGTAAAETKDTEQIIDVAGISKAVKESTVPLYQALEDTQLKQRFESVKALLDKGNVDKDELLAQLKDLKGGIDAFTGKWEAIVEPLWAGQDTLARAVASIRRKVPDPSQGGLPAKVKKLLDNYDARLADLARRIKQAKDPVSQKRLTRIFQNLHSLRQFTDRLGRAGIEKAKIQLMLRTVQVLSRLQDQLMDATFELEKVRSILAGESEFINDYIELLEMARTANDLVATLRDMRQKGKGLGGVSANAEKVRQMSTDVAKGLEGLSKNILDDLDRELDKIAREGGRAVIETTTAGPRPDMSAEIERYSTWKLVSTEVVIE